MQELKLSFQPNGRYTNARKSIFVTSKEPLIYINNNQSDDIQKPYSDENEHLEAPQSPIRRPSSGIRSNSVRFDENTHKSDRFESK